MNIQDYIGKRVRIVKIHERDTNPAHRVGEIVVPHERSFDDAFYGYSGFSCIKTSTTLHSGTWAQFEPYEETSAPPKRRGRVKRDNLYANSELADEIDEDPEPEEIFIDLRGLYQESMSAAQIASVIDRIRQAAINASDDPPELAKLTCLVD